MKLRIAKKIIKQSVFVDEKDGTWNSARIWRYETKTIIAAIKRIKPPFWQEMISGSWELMVCLMWRNKTLRKECRYGHS